MALAPATDKYDTKYMIANILYICRMNAHKFLSKKNEKNEDDLPTNSAVCFCEVVFLHFLGSQEEDYVSPPPPPLPPTAGGESGGRGIGGGAKKISTFSTDHGIPHLLFFIT